MTDSASTEVQTATGPSIAYVVDPRFPGGTSSAVASELEAVSAVARVTVHALETRMFKGRAVAPQLAEVLTRLRLPLIWDSPRICADLIVFHNPSCLKFQDSLGTKLFARHIVVVTHENFLRPGEVEAFDVGKCIAQIDVASLALKRSLAPVSDWNRATVDRWLASRGNPWNWSVSAENWFNICDMALVPPTSSPRDRRGRHSRPGREKFPSAQVLDLCFPETAECNTILGADTLMGAGRRPRHWCLYPFRGLSLEQFFERVDFLVYYTAPTWRESFGRVIAEGIAAGKIVLTDAETARSFQGGAIATSPGDIDATIARYIADPECYQEDVLSAQSKLAAFSADAFRHRFSTLIFQTAGRAS